jgi:hypothetical protein
MGRCVIASAVVVQRLDSRAREAVALKRELMNSCGERIRSFRVGNGLSAMASGPIAVASSRFAVPLRRFAIVARLFAVT